MPHLDDAAGVRTHYLDEGKGNPVVVLHGGLETADDWSFLARELTPRRRVLRPERRGHGGTPDVDGDYTYDLMADETIAFIDQVVGGQTDLVGYSDGATTAMLVALERPDLVRSLVLISGHFHHGAIVAPMSDRLAHPDPDNPRLGPIRDAYASKSPDGIEHWPIFHRKVSTLGATQPARSVDELAAITCPTLVVAADDDVIELHHIVDQYHAIADARLAVVPHASHLLHHEAPSTVANLVRDFLDGTEPDRIMPMRTTSTPAGNR